MQICEIKYATASAVDNMAIDATMLAFGGNIGEIMWRLYGWSEPAVTFGYSQNWSWIKTYMEGFEGACIRRITGGGIVDHRHDLTYAVTIPSCHPLHREPAINLYREIHSHIAEILLDQGFMADLAPCRETCLGGTAMAPGICFEGPEPFDVVHKTSGMKLAGAAMKRTQSGVLIQGSLGMRELPGLSRDIFEREFGSALGRWLQAQKVEFTGILPADMLAGERTRFASAEWNQKR